jgi:thiamine biosynthesis protein ThiS
MNLLLNGEPASAPESLSVAQFLDRLGLPRKGLAVELNRQIVPRSSYDNVWLSDGDRVEIVQFVGGG